MLIATLLGLLIAALLGLLIHPLLGLLLALGALIRALLGLLIIALPGLVNGIIRLGGRALEETTTATAFLRLRRCHLLRLFTALWLGIHIAPAATFNLAGYLALTLAWVKLLATAGGGQLLVYVAKFLLFVALQATGPIETVARRLAGLIVWH